MKCIKLVIPLALLAVAGYSQGILFEKKLSWDQIKAKAKEEGKLIFLDCYATWCAPCKQMDKEVFPQKKVGDYFNERFISVKIQMDGSTNDSVQFRDWHAVADTIKARTKIEVYPTFLFLTPEGKLLHKGLGSRSGSGLIMMASDVVSASILDSISEVRLEPLKDKEVSTQTISQLQSAFGRSGAVDYGRDTTWLAFAKKIDDQYRNGQLIPEEAIPLGNIWVLNKSAWKVFEECNEEAILKRALVWSEVSISLDKMTIERKGWTNVQLLDTRANLLYKLGRIEEAIEQEEKAIGIDYEETKKIAGTEKGNFAEAYEKTLAKMKAGHATWPE